MVTTGRQGLLRCGIASSVLYVAMNTGIPLLWPEYSSRSQTVSELSAIGAPTRTLWVVLVTAYTLLYAAFGLGVRARAGDSQRLRAAGSVIIAHGIFGLFWPPMHLRGAPFSLTDALHIAFTMVTLVLMLLTMGYAASALGTRFRRYSIATVAVFMVFGALTATGAPNIARNLPTPWIGVWERVNIDAFMVWVMVLAVTLLRRPAR